MNEVAGELALINNSEHRLSSKLEFVSASSSDIGTTDLQDKLTSCDKKVHWNCKYVQLLLDCVESRMHEFKNKSIHKKVWDDIGKEMQIYGFSTEHCYNKWKNLRRDVRMFAINPHKATKNQDTLNRVKKLISTICPNFDPTAVYKKSTKSPNKHSEESSNSLEPLTKLLTPPTSPFSDMLTPVNGDNVHMHDGSGDGGDELAVRDGGGGALFDMKLSLGSDVYSYLLKQQQQQQQQQQQHNSAALLFHPHMGPNLFLSTADKDNSSHHSGHHGSVSNECGKPNNVQCLHTRPDNQQQQPSPHQHQLQKSSIAVVAATTNVEQLSPAAGECNKNGGASSNYATWPYELYDLLVSFRTEEVKQAHSIDQLMRQIGEIRESSVRRMNTIQQLMNLANLLISSKIS